MEIISTQKLYPPSISCRFSPCIPMTNDDSNALQYFIFVYLIFMSLIVLYFLHSTSVLSFYIDVVLTLSMVKCWRLVRISFLWPLLNFLHTLNVVIINGVNHLPDWNLCQIYCRLFFFNFPDNKIPWAPWVANAGHSHGLHIDCHCWDPQGLAVSCCLGPAFLPSTHVYVGPTWSPI